MFICKIWLEEYLAFARKYVTHDRINTETSSFEISNLGVEPVKTDHINIT